MNINGAALSQLNTGKSAEVKGSGCAKNDWMKLALTDAIDKFGADVCIVENAPALSTTKGTGVADSLYQICKERGYSLTLYKTSTHFHGIPQRRDRTFAIAWNSPVAPIMDYYKDEYVPFADYLKQVPADASLQEIINPKVANEPYYAFIKHKLGKNDVRAEISAQTKTAFDWVNDNGLLHEADKWFHETNDELGIKLSQHAIKKFAMGLGIWNGSVHVFQDYTAAIIGRNLNDTIHPSEDRSLTIREAMHMMGLPHDYELINPRRNINHIAQNVTTCSSKAMTEQAIKFLRGELPFSNSSYIKQDNWNKKITDRQPKEINVLDNFFA